LQVRRGYGVPAPSPRDSVPESNQTARRQWLSKCGNDANDVHGLSLRTTMPHTSAATNAPSARRAPTHSTAFARIVAASWSAGRVVQRIRNLPPDRTAASVSLLLPSRARADAAPG